MPTRSPFSQGSKQSATSGTRATGPGSAWPAAPFHTVLLLLALSACGDNVPHHPAQVTITPQSATLTHIGATARFTARITDQNGENYPGTVTWSASDPTVFTVADDGVVTATGNGAGTLTASVRDISATALVNVEQLPFDLVIISGDGQTGNALEPLADSLVVRAEDAGGTPIEGLSVTFTPRLYGVGAAADPPTAVTDAAGLVRTSWTLGWGESGVRYLFAWPTPPPPGERPWSLAHAGFAAAVGPLDPPSRSAAYEVTFGGIWADRFHPNRPVPSGARWSPLIGAVHSSRTSFWEMGETSSPGMERMAEAGTTGILSSEITRQIPHNALSVISASGGPGWGDRRIQIVADLDNPLITLVSKMDPSPDWFAGVTGLSLLDGLGQWIPGRYFYLVPLDAGTDSGASYTAEDADTWPKEPIHGRSGMAPFSRFPMVILVVTRTDGPGGGG